jgi:hypothetical protein
MDRYGFEFCGVFSVIPRQEQQQYTHPHSIRAKTEKMSTSDVIQMCQQVKRMFASDDDLQSVLKVRRTEAEIQRRFLAQQKEAMNIVKEMTRTVSSLKALSSSADSDRHEAKVEHIMRQQEKASSNILEMKSQHKRYLEEKENVRQVQKKAAAEKERIHLENEEFLARGSQERSLYMAISLVMWDYSREDRYKGFINGKSCVKNFNMEESLGDAECTDLLWGLIGEMCE